MAEDFIKINVTQTPDGTYSAALPESRLTVGVTKKKATKTPLPQEEKWNNEWAKWGNTDCFPTDVREKIEKVPVAAAAVARLISMMYGNGLAYYRNSDLAEGNLSPQRAYIPEVETFLQQNRICTEWLPAQFADYRYYMNSFCEFLMGSGDSRQIVGLHHLPAEFTRLAVQSEKAPYRIPNIVFSPEFALRKVPTTNRKANVPLINKFDFSFHEDYREKILKGNKFCWHTKFPTPGVLYYARPFWLPLFRKEGWMDVSINVSEIVNSMQKNQVILKYQILIPEGYFKIRYMEWDTYTDKKRGGLINKKIDEINAMLEGTDSLYKSIATVFRESEMGEPERGRIQIIPIDDKLKEDKWVPSSQNADAQIVQGLGVHPSQMGLGHGGGKLGGSGGSEQRESFNTAINLNTIEQDLVLEPLNFVAAFNAETNPDWDITFFIDHTTHTTTNNQEDGLKKSDTTIEPK